MKIEVTQEHINNGERGSSCHCAVALALKEALSTRQVKVSIFDIRVITDRFNVLYPTRGYLAEWILDFDNGREVEPFSFDLPDDLLTGR